MQFNFFSDISRASVENIMNADFIHCFCFDSGNFKTMSLDKMRMLPNQFRKMPKLAMKAKLYGKKLLMITKRENLAMNDVYECMALNGAVERKGLVRLNIWCDMKTRFKWFLWNLRQLDFINNKIVGGTVNDVTLTFFLSFLFAQV